MSAGSAGPESRAVQPESIRRGSLTPAERELSGSRAVLAVLDSAVALMGGLGGVVHERSPGTGRLHLIAASGLTPEIIEAWKDLRVEQGVAPARAVREGVLVSVAGERILSEVCSTVAVPLIGIDGPIGALSLLTGTPSTLDREQRSSLFRIAAWFAGYLDGFREAPETASAGAGRPIPVTHSSAQETPRPRREPVLTVDDGWRITYLNEETEHLFGTGPTPLGRVLWDLSAGNVPGLEAQCRQAYVEGTPVAFTVRWPADGRLFHVRCSPVVKAAGMTISFTDVANGLDISEAIDQRARETGRAASEQLAATWAARMDRMTAALAEAVTSPDVVRSVADHLLPSFDADGMGIQVLESGRLQVIGNVGYPSEYLRRVGTIRLQDFPTIAEVLRTRTPRFIESEAQFPDLAPEQTRTLGASPMKAWAFLPLTTSGRVIGVCIISYRRPHVFSSDERTLITASSGVIAQALERARLYDVEHARAQKLQRALLPKTLPVLPAVRVAARYLPVGMDEEVGGDWYDVIPLSADRVAMVIGDVMGHGIAEAATMGRLRTAVRTLAELEMPPDELFGHLNELVSNLSEECFATCLYAVFDPVAQICTICSAGHPPPAVVRPDGMVEYPALPLDPPLGTATPPFTAHELPLPGEHILVFCTDGLLEAATGEVDRGLARLRRTLSDAMTGMLPIVLDGEDGTVDLLNDLCDTIISALIPDREHTNDDAALLIAHTRCTAGGDVATFDLPDDPRAAGQARQYVREQLAVWRLDDLTMTTELVVSELVGNVIRHAKGPMRLRLLRSQSLICEVYDGSLSTPRVRRASFTDEGGRGLHMVSQLCQRWGARYLTDGKSIWAEQGLP